MSSPARPARRGLGRGLGALIPTGPVETDTDGAAGTPDSRSSAPGGGDGVGRSLAGAHRAQTDDVSAETTGVDPQQGVPGYSTGGGPGPADDAPDTADPGSQPQDEPVAGAYFREIPIEAVRPNHRQPRQVFEEEALAELVHSIREIGLLQPVVVRPAEDGQYELIMGERRWRASQEAGLELIPAIVRETDDGDMLRDALLENLHRSQLNALEEAAAYGQLLEDFGCTHEELAQRIGRSRPQISNTLRLLKLSPAVQRRVAAGVLSAGHARALLAVEDADLQDRLAQRVVAEGISVRALEEIVALGDHGKPRAAARRSKPVAPGLVDLADRLSDRFETRVKVDLGKSKGKITVEFASMEDLRRIVDVMDPNRDADT